MRYLLGALFTLTLFAVWQELQAQPFSDARSASFLRLTGGTVTGDITSSGGAGAITLTDSDSSFVLPDNDTTALVIGSTDQLNLLTLDTGDDTETVIVTGTTTTTALHVDVGDALFDEDVAALGTITSTRATDLGWTGQAAANQACNTTCTSACVAGIDLVTFPATTGFLLCTDATADYCLCAGAS